MNYIIFGLSATGYLLVCWWFLWLASRNMVLHNKLRELNYTVNEIVKTLQTTPVLTYNRKTGYKEEITLLQKRPIDIPPET